MSELLSEAKFPAPLDRAAVAADWAARGYSCGLFDDPPGRIWEGFVHATNELVTVAEGRLEIEIDGTCLTAEPGDEVFIPQGRGAFGAQPARRHHALALWL